VSGKFRHFGHEVVIGCELRIRKSGFENQLTKFLRKTCKIFSSVQFSTIVYVRPILVASSLVADLGRTFK